MAADNEQRGEDEGFLKQPRGSMPRIQSLWAWLSVDPIDGNEGVLGMYTPVGWMPLIASDKVRLAEYRKVAEQIVQTSGIKARLAKFSVREDISEIGAGGLQ